MSSIYTIVRDHVLRVLHYYSRNLDKTPSLQHICCPCPISTSSLPSMSSPHTISSTNFLSEYHFFLHSTSQNPTSTAHVQNTTPPTEVLSEYHISPLMSMSQNLLPMSTVNTTSLSCLCPFRIQLLLLIVIQLQCIHRQIQSIYHISEP